MKFLFICGSRGEWGYIRPLLDICKKKKNKIRNFLNKLVFNRSVWKSH